MQNAPASSGHASIIPAVRSWKVPVIEFALSASLTGELASIFLVCGYQESEADSEIAVQFQ